MFNLAMLAIPAIAGSALFGGAHTPAPTASLPHTQVAIVQVNHDPDTGVSGTYWSNDNFTRIFSVRETAPGTYDVQSSDIGTWNAIPRAIAPLSAGNTAMGTNEHGLIIGRADFTVSSEAGGASEANLRAALGGHLVVSNGSVSYTQLVQDLFPAGATITGDFNTYSWTYFGPHGEKMVQATAGNTDTPVGLFTNGG